MKLSCILLKNHPYRSCKFRYTILEFQGVTPNQQHDYHILKKFKFHLKYRNRKPNLALIYQFSIGTTY